MTRNKFEAKVEKTLPKEFEYEPIKLPYRIEHNYIPDFVDIDGKRIIETKGLFDEDDRRKMLAVRDQHPDWHITMVFQNPNLKIRKGSRTSYGDWCDKHGIDWRSV